MRLKNKAITDAAVIDALLAKAHCCRLGMCMDNIPYVVPMNYVHEGNTMYLHCAKAGKRYEILQQNPNVCIEVDITDGVIAPRSETNGCSVSFKYQSIIANGKAQTVEDEEEKKRILDLICIKYLGEKVTMPREGIIATLVLAIDMEEISAKASGDWG